MTDEPRSHTDASDAQLADLIAQLVATAMDPRKTAQATEIARQIEAAAPGSMQNLSDRLDVGKVRQGRVTVQ